MKRLGRAGESYLEEGAGGGGGQTDQCFQSWAPHGLTLWNGSYSLAAQFNSAQAGRASMVVEP